MTSWLGWGRGGKDAYGGVEFWHTPDRCGWLDKQGKAASCIQDLWVHVETHTNDVNDAPLRVLQANTSKHGAGGELGRYCGPGLSEQGAVCMDQCSVRICMSRTNRVAGHFHALHALPAPATAQSTNDKQGVGLTSLLTSLAVHAPRRHVGAQPCTACAGYHALTHANPYCKKLKPYTKHSTWQR